MQAEYEDLWYFNNQSADTFVLLTNVILEVPSHRLSTVCPDVFELPVISCDHHLHQQAASTRVYVSDAERLPQNAGVPQLTELKLRLRIYLVLPQASGHVLKGCILVADRVPQHAGRTNCRMPGSLHDQKPCNRT